jgi:hypothetical protein
MKIQGIPFLTVSEFIRAKLKSWMMYAASAIPLTLKILLKILTSSRGLDVDAQDITYALSRHWNRVDINRIPEQDMNQFVARNTAAAPAWGAVKRKYGI